jgi:hypothetical protein
MPKEKEKPVAPPVVEPSTDVIIRKTKLVG